MQTMLHIDSWTECNVWLHTVKANYRIVKAAGEWYVSQETKPGREWKFITEKTFQTASEAVQELEMILETNKG